jgi:manganese/zinc/iron transport system ATP- binding protein
MKPLDRDTMQKAAIDFRPVIEPESAFQVEGLSAAYNGMPVVVDVSLNAPAGAITAIMGPNGAGKSTFLKAALGLIPRLSGKTLVFGKPLSRDRREIAYVPQRAAVDWDFPACVMDVVMMGLQPEIGWLRSPTAMHERRAHAALAAVGMDGFAARQIGQLSGGQRQRVFLARALVQEAPVMILDEPFAGIDAATEQTIVDIFRSLKKAGRSIIAVHHDLATARDYFDHVLLMNVIKIAEGPVEAVLSEDNIALAYGTRRGDFPAGPVPALTRGSGAPR